MVNKLYAHFRKYWPNKKVSRCQSDDYTAMVDSQALEEAPTIAEPTSEPSAAPESSCVEKTAPEEKPLEEPYFDKDSVKWNRDARIAELMFLIWYWFV